MSRADDPDDASRAAVTIDDALDRFLDSQRTRLAPRTFRRYQDVIGLLGHCLNSYGYIGLSELEHQRYRQAHDARDRETFCHLFGPERIVDSLGELACDEDRCRILNG
jgi:hypothetical protein